MYLLALLSVTLLIISSQACCLAFCLELTGGAAVAWTVGPVSVVAALELARAPARGKHAQTWEALDRIRLILRGSVWCECGCGCVGWSVLGPASWLPGEPARREGLRGRAAAFLRRRALRKLGGSDLFLSSHTTQSILKSRHSQRLISNPDTHWILTHALPSLLVSADEGNVRAARQVQSLIADGGADLCPSPTLSPALVPPSCSASLVLLLLV